jgi:hypothetical protein
MYPERQPERGPITYKLASAKHVDGGSMTDTKTARYSVALTVANKGQLLVVTTVA